MKRITTLFTGLYTGMNAGKQLRVGELYATADQVEQEAATRSDTLLKVLELHVTEQHLDYIKSKCSAPTTQFPPILDYEIEQADVDVDASFCWLIFKIGNDSYFLSACLNQNTRLDKRFSKTISRIDDGMTWGICGDNNHKAFQAFGVDKCRKFFFKEMRRIGVRRI